MRGVKSYPAFFLCCSLKQYSNHKAQNSMLNAQRKTHDNRDALDYGEMRVSFPDLGGSSLI
jgi:hypothetical protein